MTGNDEKSGDRWHLCEPEFDYYEEAQMKRITTTIEIRTVSFRGRLSVFAKLAASAAAVLAFGRVNLTYQGKKRGVK